MIAPQTGRSAGRMPNPTRFGVSGAFVILACTLILACSCGQRGDAPGDTDNIVIARAGGREITVADLDAKMRVQFAAMADMGGLAGIRQRHEVLRSMVEQLAWVGEGERLGFEDDPEFKETLELSRQFILSRLTIRRLVQEKAVPTGEELREYYEDNLDQFRTVARVRASHILLPTRAEAERVRNLALRGEDFAELSHRYSLDEVSRHQDGDIGYITATSTIRNFSREESPNQGVMHLGVGGISEPLETSRGWSIFRVDERVEAAQRSFEDAREQIADIVEKRNANRIFAATLAGIREQTGSEINEDGWLLYTARFLSEDELFQLANSEKGPEERIRIYELVMREHPDGARSPQALFMTGFTYAENLRDHEKAREVFRYVLDRYPDHELAASARWMIDNMDQGLDVPQAVDIRRRALAL